MATERRYRIGYGDAEGEYIVFDGTAYTLQSIDYDTVDDNASTLKGKVGEKYLSSQYSSRDIKITFYAQVSPVSGVVTPDYKEIARLRNEIQRCTALGSTLTLTIEEIRSGSWLPIYTIECRTLSSIDWATTYNDNNAFVCKGVMKLRADSPFFKERIIDQSDMTQVIRTPYSDDYFDYITVADYSHNNQLRFNYIGANPLNDYSLMITTDSPHEYVANLRIGYDLSSYDNCVVFACSGTLVDEEHPIIYHFKNSTCEGVFRLDFTNKTLKLPLLYGENILKVQLEAIGGGGPLSDVRAKFIDTGIDFLNV